MKLFSSEIRWFSSEKEELRKIFNSLPGTCFKEDERTDYYIRTHSKDIGIKIRGGTERVEIKWLINKRSEFYSEDKTIGFIEDWVKSGFNSNDIIFDKILSESKIESNWNKIKKLRYKKKYEVLKNGQIQPMLSDKLLINGCSAEYTEILINEVYKYYSIGFESLNEKSICRKYLDLTLKLCMEYLNPNILKGSVSMGYPQLIILNDQRM